MKTRIAFAAVLFGMPPAMGFHVHEWGTFTTVSGSDGVLLSGLQREEEVLPPFVHAHFGLENGQTPAEGELKRIFSRHGTLGFTPPGSKGLGKRPVEAVTVKMETPVIYFHSDRALKARVKVGFEGGTISQWYPSRSGGETLPEPAAPANPTKSPTPIKDWTLDFSKPYQGGIEWDVDVLSPEQSRRTLTFKPRDSVNWMRARISEANVVRAHNGETENYLFYRGIGNFTPGLRATVTSGETLHLENQCGGDIPYLLVFERRGGQVRWWARADRLDAGAGLDVEESSLVSVGEGFPLAIYQSLKSGLTGRGLLESEADAMVQTWWSSYFERDGLRVFWILPESATHRILPLSVTPAPERVVRVIVGRSEVLRPREEKQWLAMSRLTGEALVPWISLVGSDRFGLAIAERVKALEREPGATARK